VSADFNSRLLNKIASERFSETRSQAYFPKKSPALIWSRAIPVVATACLVLAFILTGGINNFMTQSNSEQIASTTSQALDDRYLTVQPQSNHALVQHVSIPSAGKNWSFHGQLARVNRIRSLMNAMQSQNNFVSYSSEVIETPQICCGPRLMIEWPASQTAEKAASQIRMVSEGNGSN
jgi:hypothetical protein